MTDIFLHSVWSCCLLQVYDRKVHPNLDALQLDGAYPFERTKRGAIVWGFAKPGGKSVSSLQAPIGPLCPL